MATILGGFKFQLKEPKKQRTSSTYKRERKITSGVVISENGEFKVKLDDDTIIPFTPESYDLTGRKTVFAKYLDENGKKVCIIRDANKAKVMPGLPEQYTPFATNWIVKGYVVIKNYVKFFSFTDLVGINGYTNVDYEEE